MCAGASVLITQGRKPPQHKVWAQSSHIGGFMNQAAAGGSARIAVAGRPGIRRAAAGAAAGCPLIRARRGGVVDGRDGIQWGRGRVLGERL